MCIFTDQFLSFPEERSHEEIQKTNDYGSKVYLYFIAPIWVESTEPQKETKEDNGGSWEGGQGWTRWGDSTECKRDGAIWKRSQNSRQTTLRWLFASRYSPRASVSKVVETPWWLQLKQRNTFWLYGDHKPAAEATPQNLIPVNMDESRKIPVAFPPGTRNTERLLLVFLSLLLFVCLSVFVFLIN